MSREAQSPPVQSQPDVVEFDLEHPPPNVSRKQAAWALLVTERTVDRWRASGKLPGSFTVRDSRRVLIPSRSVLALLALLVIIATVLSMLICSLRIDALEDADPAMWLFGDGCSLMFG